MAMETSAILRQLLYQVMKAKTLKEAEGAIKVMCTKDDIAAVLTQIEEDKLEK
jgi:hypothetical protein